MKYAITWQNPNEGYELQLPSFKITGKTEDGKIAFSDEHTMNWMRPKEKQTFSSSAGNGTVPSTVEFAVNTNLKEYNYVKSDKQAEEYYSISNTNEVTDDFWKTFTGEVTSNVELEDVSSIAIYLVLRDDSNKIAYGAYSFVSAVSVGQSTSFEVRISNSDIPAYSKYELYALPWM